MSNKSTQEKLESTHQNAKRQLKILARTFVRTISKFRSETARGRSIYRTILRTLPSLYACNELSKSCCEFRMSLVRHTTLSVRNVYIANPFENRFISRHVKRTRHPALRKRILWIPETEEHGGGHLFQWTRNTPCTTGAWIISRNSEEGERVVNQIINCGTKRNRKKTRHREGASAC